MVLVVPLHEILQNGATLPDLELAAIFTRVDNGWNAAVGVDVEVPLLLLLVLKKLDHADLDPDCVRFSKLSISATGSIIYWSLTLYFKPSSSSAIEILSGLGVPSQ